MQRSVNKSFSKFFKKSQVSLKELIPDVLLPLSLHNLGHIAQIKLIFLTFSSVDHLTLPWVIQHCYLQYTLTKPTSKTALFIPFLENNIYSKYGKMNLMLYAFLLFKIQTPKSQINVNWPNLPYMTNSLKMQTPGRITLHHSHYCLGPLPISLINF